jgi:hypothetical protein
MSKAFDNGNGVTCWQVDGDFYVYRGEKLIRVCPSIGMAREVAASL